MAAGARVALSADFGWFVALLAAACVALWKHVRRIKVIGACALVGLAYSSYM